MATRASDEDRAQLAALAAEMRLLAEDVANARRVLATDQAFHSLIAQAATNRVLAAVSRSFWDAVSVIPWLESHLGARELRRQWPSSTRRSPRRSRGATQRRLRPRWRRICAPPRRWTSATSRTAARPTRADTHVGLHVGIDTGGTFTDLIAVDPQAGTL